MNMTKIKLEKLRSTKLGAPREIFDEALRAYEMAVSDFIDEFITHNDAEQFDELLYETIDDGYLLQEAPYYAHLEAMIETYCYKHLKSKAEK